VLVDHSAFWDYVAAYGEDLGEFLPKKISSCRFPIHIRLCILLSSSARQFYGDFSPPPGTTAPIGVVDPTKSADTVVEATNQTGRSAAVVATDSGDEETAARPLQSTKLQVGLRSVSDQPRAFSSEEAPSTSSTYYGLSSNSLMPNSLMPFISANGGKKRSYEVFAPETAFV
jgi:hypothetical protein